jgi:hypothetical protein
MTTAEPVRRGEVVHVAGPCITFAGRWVRQRCVWCGHVLIDMDLARTANQSARWAVDALVHVDGSMSWVDTADDNDEGRVPDRCCMCLDPAVAGGWMRRAHRSRLNIEQQAIAARLAAAQQEIGRLTVRGRQEAAISDVMRDRALTAERRVARVQALCDDPGALYYGEDGELSALLANDVRAALDGTQ